MKRTIVSLCTLCWLACAGFTEGLRAQSPDPNLFRDREVAAMQPTKISAPTFALEGYELRLVVLNMTSRVVDFSLLGMSGQMPPRLLSQHSIESQRHLEIPISPTFDLEHYQLSFVDLPGALDARLVAHGVIDSLEGEVVSYPFKRVGVPLPEEEIFVWPDVQETQASFRLINHSAQPSAYTLLTSEGSADFTLPPQQVATHVAQGGLLRLSQPEAGSLLAWGLQDFKGRKIHLPARSPQEHRPLLSELTTLHVPTFDQTVENVFVTLANTSSETLVVPLQVVNTFSNLPLASDFVELEPNSPHTLDLTKRWPFLEAHWEEARITFGPTSSSVSAFGFVSSKEHQLVELSFQELDTAHGSGMYPIPNLNSTDATLHLLNTGSVNASVGVELSWKPQNDSSLTAHSYSMGPFEISAGHGFRLNLRDQLQKQVPDMLERMPPQSFDEGFLKWIAIAGEKKLLGRTEVLDRRSQDRFGINCETCCWETPTGVVINNSVTLSTANATKKFETGIEYDTCSGRSGPFYQPAGSLDYKAPFSWDGKRVSASSDAEEDLSWDGTVMAIDDNCRLYNVGLFGKGKVDACKLALVCSCCNGGKCKQNVACGSQTKNADNCYSCCDQQLAYNTCKKVARSIRDAEHSACIGVCINDHETLVDTK